MEIKPRLFYRVVKIQGRPRPLTFYIFEGHFGHPLSKRRLIDCLLFYTVSLVWRQIDENEIVQMLNFSYNPFGWEPLC